MDHPERAARVDQFITWVKFMLIILGVMAIVSFCVIVAGIADARKQTLNAIQAMARRLNELDTRATTSEKDRADLHEATGAIREALKRLEAQSK